MQHYPLIFTLRDAVSGNGFLAGVTITGRALMVKEQESWWVYGVRPGGIADTGQTFEAAYLRFRNKYKETLFDIAEESASFELFKVEVERFFHDTTRADEEQWHAAVEAIRQKSPGEIEAPLAALPRERPEHRPTGVSVERLDQAKHLRASDNVSDMYALADAA